MTGSHEDREAARARLQAVRERFAGRLAERVAELVAGIERARSGQGGIADPLALAHRLAGTAGSYGWVDAGTQAARVELLLRRIEGGEPAWEELEDAVKRLRAELEPEPSPSTG